MSTRVDALRKTSQKGRKTKQTRGDIAIAPDNPLLTERGVDDEHQNNAMAQGADDANSSLLWRRVKQPSQSMTDGLKMPYSAAPTPTPSGMEGALPSIEGIEVTPDLNIPSEDDEQGGSSGTYPST
jgi:hypothetical protein